MAVKQSKQSVRRWMLLLGSGLLGLLLFLTFRTKKSKDVKDLIIKLLTTTNTIMDSRGTVHKVKPLSVQMAKFWVCVSAFETANFTSRIFKEDFNPWGMTLASKNTTAIGAIATGERQAYYRNINEGIIDILLYMQKRWNYPDNFVTLDDLVDYMKSKNYFMSSALEYKAGVNMYYKKFFAQ